jgi:hypothetical protein
LIVKEHFFGTDQDKKRSSMRLKLVLIASLIAAIGGAGSSIAIVLAVFASLKPVSRPGLLVSSTFLLPVGAITFASIFVYRHTARRRKLQALLAAMLATLLSLGLFLVASILSARHNPIEPPQPVRSNITT